MTTILIKKKDTAGAPAPGDLTNSAGGTEIAVNTATKRIYTKDSGGNVVELGTNSTSSTIVDLTVTNSATLSYGTINQVQYLNGSKILTGSANMTFSGTQLTLANDAFVSGLTLGRGASAVVSNTAFGVTALNTNTTGIYNTSIGYESLRVNTTGVSNTGVGYQAGYQNTTGSRNSAFGTAALPNNTTANDNTAVGYFSLLQNTTGANNVALGASSLQSNTTGASNTALGYQALYANTTASELTAIGYQALFANTTGTGSTALGHAALRQATTANYNTALGYTALYSTTTGGNNTAVGFRPLYTNTTGIGNCAFGQDALYFNTTGNSNVAIGLQALNSNTTASNNTSVGYQAGYSNIVGTRNVYVGRLSGNAATGDFNTFVGDQTGNSTTTGSFNTFIGIVAGSAISTGSKNTLIGGYNGNNGGLDIRTASNYAVISDGDGIPLISTSFGRSVALEGAVPQTGEGITFPATQSASSNANTLDDYEEGTFTPVIGSDSTITGATYTSQYGFYIKIGRMVFIRGTMLMTNKGTGGSGTVRITGLPFPATGGPAGYAYQPMNFYFYPEGGLSGSIDATVYDNSSQLILSSPFNATNVISWSTLVNAEKMSFAGCYTVDN